MQELQGKTALITGSTIGIGREVARQLAAKGATAIVSGRNVERGDATVSEIEAAGGSARFIAADLTDIESVRRLAASAGDVDILINNAAAYSVGATADVTEADFDEMFTTNVRAPFFLTAALAPAMMSKGSGVIVNVSTMVSAMGVAGMAAYSATKSALNSLTRTWAAEFGAAGVRVNAIAPGPTATDMVIETLGAEGAAQVAGLTILGRLADPREIANVIVFLAGDQSSYITGATLFADAGATAR
ncbi:MAG: short-chain dehydrogenase/reductase [Ilumatobacteraceae bacterium]|nr:short-chain dehydrogenase/reductase [Ilumatobacteraceae bacterium]